MEKLKIYVDASTHLKHWKSVLQVIATLTLIIGIFIALIALFTGKPGLKLGITLILASFGGYVAATILESLSSITKGAEYYIATLQQKYEVEEHRKKLE